MQRPLNCPDGFYANFFQVHNFIRGCNTPSKEPHIPAMQFGVSGESWLCYDLGNDPEASLKETDPRRSQLIPFCFLSSFLKYGGDD